MIRLRLEIINASVYCFIVYQFIVQQFIFLFSNNLPNLNSIFYVVMVKINVSQFAKFPLKNNGILKVSLVLSVTILYMKCIERVEFSKRIDTGTQYITLYFTFYNFS